MGNKLCKKKSDVVDNPKSPTPFDRIINRLHLRPTSWKSESHLNQKQANTKCQIHPKDPKNAGSNVTTVHPLSKSSDWTEVYLEVPETEEPIHLRNPKLSLIFANEKTIPIPPPRKHKKGFKEKLEAVAKSSFQAFQSKKPVEEPLCVKKIVKPTCPIDGHDCAIHHKTHKHEQKKNEKNDVKSEERLRLIEKEIKVNNKEAKRKKNLSVISLPNYNELKLTVANFDDIDNKPENLTSSMASLPGESKKTNIKLDKNMPRCRSFGSLLPQQLLDKLRVRKIPTDIESDDSFGGLEDWDLGIIEHYNPKDASLPRPIKLPRTGNESVLSDIENLIVKDEDCKKPVVPARRSESLLKKINREAVNSVVNRRPNQEVYNKAGNDTAPLPLTDQNNKEYPITFIPADNLATEENGQVEHSSLMKILEEFSMKDKQRNLLQDETFPEIDKISEIEQNGDIKMEKKICSIEDFLYNEKLNATSDVHQTNVPKMEMVKT